MKFSIITSFYNTERFVDSIYESLLSQTYQNWEWIVTDDFSDQHDDTKSKLLEISNKDSRVKYIDQEKKLEIFFNPHKYSSIDSSFILDIGSDDILYPKCLEVYKHFLVKNTEVICLTSGGRRLQDDLFYNFIYANHNDGYNANHEDNKGYDLSEFPITRCWRHIPYPTLNFNPDNKYTKRRSDFNTLLRLEEIGKILPINRCLSDIRIINNSLSNSNIKSKEAETTFENMKNDMYDRRSNIKLNTFIKNTSEENSYLEGFYIDLISKSDRFLKINILNDNIPINVIGKLKETFFDHNLNFKGEDRYVEDFDYNFLFVMNEDDINYLFNNKDLINKNTIIYSIKYNVVSEFLVPNNIRNMWISCFNCFWVSIL